MNEYSITYYNILDEVVSTVIKADTLKDAVDRVTNYIDCTTLLCAVLLSKENREFSLK
jgi:hypothetical protein